WRVRVDDHRGAGPDTALERFVQRVRIGEADVLTRVLELVAKEAGIVRRIEPAAQHDVAVRAQLALDVDVRVRERDMDLRPGRILYGGPDAVDVGAHRPSQRCDRGAGYFSGDPLDRQEIPW